jgi:hypothetical protein
MTPNAFRKLCLAASLVLAAGPVAAAEPAVSHEQRIERLTDSMVVLMPFGTIFEGIAAEEPAWPVMEQIDEVTAKELVCLRGELSSKGYRRYTRGLVKDYADANPQRLDADIALVESGVAEMFGKLVLAGAEGERTGVEANPDELLAEYSPAQLEAFMTFFSAAEYAGLRRLAGVGNQFDENKTAEENEAAGEKLGSDLASKLMFRAMDTCGVELP